MFKNSAIIDVTAKKESVHPKENGLVVYETDIAMDLDENSPAFLFLPDGSESRDMVIMNPIYRGGKLQVKMKPIKSQHAKKFNVGEVIATLVVPTNVKEKE